MTTRDDARRTTDEPRAEGLRLVPPRDELERERSRRPEPPADDVDTAAGASRPSPLSERLYAARERKGVDLYRAERDTKIRARYLAALERGEYRELPGDVYTKGFLRNYALYLGLDPDEVVGQWRRERGGETGPTKAILTVPRPIAQSRPGLQFSPGIVVAALLTLLIVAVGAWLGLQVMRFAKPPTLELTSPRQATVEVDEGTSAFTFEGTSIPGATITIEMAGGSRQANADSTGVWSVTVDLRRGRNEFKIDATDPETGKHAEQPAMVVITVPISEIEAPTFTIDQPAEGTIFENGAIPVRGTAANATTIQVSATYDGPVGGAPAATPSPKPSTAPSVAPAASGGPAPSGAPSGQGPAPITVTVASDGTWDTGPNPLQLTTGRWTITVTASNEAKSSTLTRHISIAYKGINLVVTLKGDAWIKVWVDGVLVPSIGSGRTFHSGKVLTFTGETSVEVRTGSSGDTTFSLNGRSLGALGKRGIPETWLFKPSGAPTQTQRS